VVRRKTSFLKKRSKKLLLRFARWWDRFGIKQGLSAQRAQARALAFLLREQK
jgi:hypothetical protein